MIAALLKQFKWREHQAVTYRTHESRCRYWRHNAKPVSFARCARRLCSSDGDWGWRHIPIDRFTRPRPPVLEVRPL